jgi:hypothetical protein
MKTSRAATVLLLGAMVAVGGVALGLAGDGPKLKAMLYEGQIKSIKIDRCGTEPGQCIGSIILAQQGGSEVELGIRPGTWIKRGNQFVYIEDLGVGNYVKLEAVQIPGDRLPQITTLSTP